mgnify:CR=1 FL=1
MSKRLFISEKPSVAQEFAKALKFNGKKQDGYMESADMIITWCVGHLITMSYPDAYDASMKRWSFDTIPFLPKKFKYEVIPNVKKQFQIISGLLNRDDVDVIYICTDSGREGEYIYRLVEQMAGVSSKKDRRRVWIDSQTEEEILRGIKEAKPISDYDNLSKAAYLRAKEDYLMGINFSRVLSLKYGTLVMNYLKSSKWSAIAVGRVMTCVLGMVVRREREIREFVKTPFYRVVAEITRDMPEEIEQSAFFEGEWRAVEGSLFFESPLLYKENGFKQQETAEKLVRYLTQEELGEEYRKEMVKVETKKKAIEKEEKNVNIKEKSKEKQEICVKGDYAAVLEKIEKKKENKNPPLLYNLAELQNDCSRFFKITPDETLAIVQELYEKKLVTYPRTDARVLSSAVAKEIDKNLVGLRRITLVSTFVDEVLNNRSYQKIAKSRYVNDSQITDHYAIIPTGQTGAVSALQGTKIKVYEIIVRRFLAIFFPPAVYQKITMVIKRREERFFSNFKVLADIGYLKVMEYSFFRKKNQTKQTMEQGMEKKGSEETTENHDQSLFELVKTWKKGSILNIKAIAIKEGETSPPKRYNSGSMILAMENAGQLIEDEELRAQIKSSGIGTSATRAEILNKLIKINYLKLNKKTQMITPELLGELVYDVVFASMKNMLNPEMTASWEKGLSMVEKGEITEEEYMNKLENYVGKMTMNVKMLGNSRELGQVFDKAAAYYIERKTEKENKKGKGNIK